MILQLNTDKLVQLSVVGEIDHPTLRKTGYVINSQGKAEVYPSVGGISYNVHIGSPAVGWMADHVEPGVSIRNTGSAAGEYSPNSALNVLACVGNSAQVISGEAKGTWGYVTGKHGGIDHVMVDFPSATLEKMTIGDKILIRSFGVGLQLVQYYPDILVMNLDPDLLQKFHVKAGEYLEIGVTHQIPAKLMGAGLGSISAHSGDYDIQIFDEKARSDYHLDTLRLGDLVAIMDSDASHGWIYREGAVTLGVVAHSNSVISGHGPGVTTLLTSSRGRIKPVIDTTANLVKYLGKMS